MCDPNAHPVHVHPKLKFSYRVFGVFIVKRTVELGSFGDKIKIRGRLNR